MKTNRRIAFAIFILSLLSLSLSAAEKLSYEVIGSYPHDEKAFTQGLYYKDGKLYESTGLYGQSSLRLVDLKTGKVLKKKPIEFRYFGEGLTKFDGKLYQLTWQENKGFIYDPATFKKTGTFSYAGEGWGLTHDNKHLIMSDGTNVIRFLDPKTFKVVRSIKVTLGKRRISDLNELEYIDGYIYANVWYTNTIIKIDPADGLVVGTLDLSKLWPEKPHNKEAILNGIAYIEETKTFLVTGKLWARLFAIRLTDPEAKVDPK